MTSLIAEHSIQNLPFKKFNIRSSVHEVSSRSSRNPWTSIKEKLQESRNSIQNSVPATHLIPEVGARSHVKKAAKNHSINRRKVFLFYISIWYTSRGKIKLMRYYKKDQKLGALWYLSWRYLLCISRPATYPFIAITSKLGCWLTFL